VLDQDWDHVLGARVLVTSVQGLAELAMAQVILVESIAPSAMALVTTLQENAGLVKAMEKPIVLNAV